MAFPIIETILFLWLSPGMLLTLPPIDGKWFSTDTTSWQAVLTHAAIFTLILTLFSNPKRNEGFQTQEEAPRAVSAVAQRQGSAIRRRLEQRKAELESL